MSYSSDKLVTLADFDRICRTCFGDVNLYDINCMKIDGVKASDLLDYSAQIKFEHTDRLPQKICMDCIKELSRSYKFKHRCLSNEAILKALLIDETDEHNVTETEHKDNIVIDLHNVLDDKSTIQEFVSCDITENAMCKDILSENIEEDINPDDDEDNEQEDIKVFQKSKLKRSTKPVVIRCAECLVKFETRELLLEHKKETNHTTEQKYPCEICSKPYTSYRMTQHMRTTHSLERPYHCEVCSMTFCTKASLKRHGMLHTGERPNVCSYCGKGFIERNALISHEKTHQNTEELSGKFDCNICGRAFIRTKAFTAHMDKHNAESLIVTKPAPEPTFPWKGQNYICEICSKGCRTKQLLQVHLLKHGGEKSFLCPVPDCGKSFYTKVALKKHSEMHTGLKPHSCTVCEKSFSQISSYNAHMLTHSGYKAYKCSFCQKRFKLPTHLTYHLRTHTGEKPYECKFCEKRFSTNGNLTVHLRRHTGETPYLCNVCGKGYPTSSGMKKHRSSHNEDNSECSTKDQEDEQSLTGSPELSKNSSNTM